MSKTFAARLNRLFETVYPPGRGPHTSAEVIAALRQTPGLLVTVDLEQQTIVCGNRTYHFAIDPVRRMRLLNGWDDIGLTLRYEKDISAFEGQRKQSQPWV